MQTHNSSRLVGPNARTRAWRNKQDNAARPVAQPLPEFAQDEDVTFRADLVARVRRQIADGTYGTEEQWEIALDGLLQHLDRMG